MVTGEGLQHFPVAVGVQDPLDNHVVPGIKGVAEDRVDQPDVGSSGPIPLAQYEPPEVVLPHKGETATEPVAKAGCHGGLPRR